MPDRLTRITTRGGDRGQSGLADGSRHPKTDTVFDALGDIDELNCVLGIVVLSAWIRQYAATDPDPASIAPLRSWWCSGDAGNDVFIRR